jgi:hypothetical protein
MAALFDEVDDYYIVSDAAEMTLQDGDWCVGIWTYVADNAGTGFQYPFSTGTYGATNSCHIMLVEASYASAGYRDKWLARTRDNDGTDSGELLSTAAPGGDSTWRLVILQRRTADNQIQMYLCDANGVPSLEDSVADTNFDAVNGGAWHLAHAADDAAPFITLWGGRLCEFWKGDFSLSSAQIQALAGGLPIKTLCAQLGYTLDCWIPGWNATDPWIDYSGNGNDAAMQSAPTSAVHAPICTPKKRHRIGG